MGCGTKLMCACFLLLNSSSYFCTVISCGQGLICVNSHATPLSLHVPKFMLYCLCYPKSSIIRNPRDLVHVAVIAPPPTNVDSWDEDHPLPPWVETSNFLFGTGLPSVLSKLVKRVEEGNLLKWLSYCPKGWQHIPWMTTTQEPPSLR